MTSERTIRGQRTLWEGVTFSVVEGSLDEDRILCESLCHQQDALLNAMSPQQGSTTSTLGKETPGHHQHKPV